MVVPLFCLAIRPWAHEMTGRIVNHHGQWYLRDTRSPFAVAVEFEEAARQIAAAMGVEIVDNTSTALRSDRGATTSTQLNRTTT